jgi:hypothetical protein
MQDKPAATFCDPCDAGDYSSELGASSCEKCGIGYISEQAAIYCTPCASGNIFSSGACEACDLGEVRKFIENSNF